MAHRPGPVPVLVQRGHHLYTHIRPRGSLPWRAAPLAEPGSWCRCSGSVEEAGRSTLAGSHRRAPSRPVNSAEDSRGCQAAHPPARRAASSWRQITQCQSERHRLVKSGQINSAPLFWIEDRSPPHEPPCQHSRLRFFFIKDQARSSLESRLRPPEASLDWNSVHLVILPLCHITQLRNSNAQLAVNVI